MVHERSKFLKLHFKLTGGAKNALHVTEVREHESSGAASQVPMVFRRDFSPPKAAT